MGGLKLQAGAEVPISVANPNTGDQAASIAFLEVLLERSRGEGVETIFTVGEAAYALQYLFTLGDEFTVLILNGDSLNRWATAPPEGVERSGRLLTNKSFESRADADMADCVAIVEAGLDGGAGPAARAAAAADLVETMERTGLEPGRLKIPHPHSSCSIQAACCREGARFSVHPGIGQDIIYPHPMLSGGAVGRVSMTDFLLFADTISELEGGVYLSVGSSVMSPMIFEKSISMARNLARSGKASPEDFHIVVNDLAESTWDWSKGEPPKDNPAYYVRFCKSFSRMGGELAYAGIDNRVFLLNLYKCLVSLS